MPGEDGRGPKGYGPGTGRGLGPCGAGFRRGYGRGMGRGFGRGLGRAGFVQSPEPTEVQEKVYLQEELEAMEAAKVGIEKRLKELKD